MAGGIDLGADRIDESKVAMSDCWPAAVVQLNSGPDRAANLAAAEHWVRAAAQAGARLVALPELFPCWTAPESMPGTAEPLDGPTFRTMGQWARDLDVVLVAGSIAERGADPARYFNTATVWGRDGRLLAQYRKMHLFDVEIPERVTYCESARVDAGSEVAWVDTELGRLGLAICYDLRFPELFRRLSAARCELIVVPSAFALGTGRDHWETLVRARAIENLCYVLAPNQFGQHTPEQVSYGHSLIVDPWGTVLAQVADGPGQGLATVDRQRQRALRAQLPALDHRRIV